MWCDSGRVGGCDIREGDGVVFGRVMGVVLGRVIGVILGRVMMA